MNMIEGLKAAYEAATVADSDVEQMCSGDAEFITLAHNMMPQMLEVISTLDEYLQRCIVDDEDRWITRELLHTRIAGLKESK